MSDIQEQIKLAHKRAEENDYDDLLRKYNNLKTALDESQEVIISYKEENNKYKEKIMILKEIVATYEIDKSNEDKFIEDLKRILWNRVEKVKE